MDTALTQAPSQLTSVITRIASRYGVDAGKLLTTLKATAFRSDKEITNEQMMALLIVADQYRLNPLTKELYAFPDKGGIVPVVGIDGWARIINEHEQFDGMEFDQPDGDGLPAWIECVIYRKDRQHPTRIREYMAECKRATGPWGSHPRRLLRHKSMIQCARMAFGFAGIYDHDEAQRIVAERDMGQAEVVYQPEPAPASRDLKEQLRSKRKPAPEGVEPKEQLFDMAEQLPDGTPRYTVGDGGEIIDHAKVTP